MVYEHELREEIKVIKDQMKEMENKVSAKDDDDNDRKSSFTGKVFIILNRPKDIQKILSEQDKRAFKTGFANYCACLMCCGDKKHQWTFRRAPEPSDIFWENMKVHPCTRIFKSLNSLIWTFLLIIMSLLIIFFIKQFKERYTNQIARRKK